MMFPGSHPAIPDPMWSGAVTAPRSSSLTALPMHVMHLVLDHLPIPEIVVTVLPVSRGIALNARTYLARRFLTDSVPQLDARVLATVPVDERMDQSNGSVAAGGGIAPRVQLAAALALGTLGAGGAADHRLAIVPLQIAAVCVDRGLAVVAPLRAAQAAAHGMGMPLDMDGYSLLASGVSPAAAAGPPSPEVSANAAAAMYAAEIPASEDDGCECIDPESPEQPLTRVTVDAAATSVWWSLKMEIAAHYQYHQRDHQAQEHSNRGELSPCEQAVTVSSVAKYKLVDYTETGPYSPTNNDVSASPAPHFGGGEGDAMQIDNEVVAPQGPRVIHGPRLVQTPTSAFSVVVRESFDEAARRVLHVATSPMVVSFARLARAWPASPVAAQPELQSRRPMDHSTPSLYSRRDSLVLAGGVSGNGGKHHGVHELPAAAVARAAAASQLVPLDYHTLGMPGTRLRGRFGGDLWTFGAPASPAVYSALMTISASSTTSQGSASGLPPPPPPFMSTSVAALATCAACFMDSHVDKLVPAMAAASLASSPAMETHPSYSRSLSSSMSSPYGTGVKIPRPLDVTLSSVRGQQQRRQRRVSGAVRAGAGSLAIGGWKRLHESELGSYHRSSGGGGYPME
ncbi:hypothetical protein BC828DRAFT_33364 [Blastocladiella britannica]|nr:hypothetical protein BC828DRAFT_33364 [Blastocladiella britannica]